MFSIKNRRRRHTRLALESLEARRLLVGELIELQLDAVQDNASIVDQNRAVELNLGEDFELRVQYDDLRAAPDDLGAFKLLTDIAISQPDTVVPLMHQVQTFVVPPSDGLEFSYDGNTTRDNQDGRITTLDFLRALNTFGITNPEVTVDGDGAGTHFVELRYSKPEDVNTNFPFMEIIATDANGVPTGAEVTTTNIAPRLPDGSLNPDALITSLNLSTPSFGGEEVYTTLVKGRYNSDSVSDTLQEVGGVGPIGPNGLQTGGSLPNPFIAYGIHMRVVGLGNNVDFSISAADDPDAVLLYGEDDSASSAVLLDDDAAFAANFRYATTAVDDSASVDEDGTVDIDVLDNDFGDALVITAVEEPTNGMATISGGMIRYTPDANFNGTESFSYVIADDSGGTSVADVTVTVNPVNDAPVAVKDSFSVDPTQQLSFSTADLIRNDNPGPGESGQTLTVTAVPTSTVEGGTLVNDAGNLTYTPPAGFVGTDSFMYTVSDGDLASHGTVEISVEFFSLPITVSLPENTANDVTLRRDADDLIVFDNIAQTEILRRPIEFIEDITVIGSDANADRITVDHTFGGVFGEGDSLGLSRAIDIIAGTSANDEVILLVESEYIVQSFEQVSDPEFVRNHFLSGVESISVGDSRDARIGLGKDLMIDAGQSLTIESFLPVSVNGSLSLEGGVLNAPIGGVFIPGGAILLGDGTVNGRIIGAVGSIIAAEDGDLILGDATSVVGFETAGDLRVGDHQVTLLDANQAVLGGLTTVGNTVSDGTLVSAGGLVIDFGGNVIGNGVIDTVNSETSPVMNNGLIQGTGDEPSLSLTGLIKGVGRLDNVTIDGTASPGFSPTIARFGDIAFANLSTLLIELGGPQAGTGYDQILSDGLATVDGTVDVQFIDDFIASAGQQFDVLQATDSLAVSLDNLQLPELPAGLEWIVDQTSQALSLIVGINVGETGNAIEISIEEGRLVARNSDGQSVPVGGSSITLTVNPTDNFDSADDWRLEGTGTEDGSFIQRFSNGNFELVVKGSQWKNFVRATDVDSSGGTSARDALVIINELRRQQFIVESTEVLIDPALVEEFPGFFFDVNGDDSLTALDALRVINQLANESQNSGLAEGESIGFLPTSESFSSEFESELFTAIESFDQPTKSLSFLEASVDAVFTVSDLQESSENQDSDQDANDEFGWFQWDQLEL